jgi:dihydrofolate reductase
MAKLVVSVLTSLDGCFEGPGRDLSTMPFEDAFNDHNLALMRAAGTLVYGGRWFADNRRAWAAVAADPASGEREQEIARLVGSLDAIVISDSVVLGEEHAATTRVVPRADGPAAVARAKETTEGDLLVFGSATTWNPLLVAGLVDELVVLVGAGLVGEGSPLFTGAPTTGLRLLDATVLRGSQLVRLRYDASGVTPVSG